MMLVLFWTSVALFVYAVIGYPLAVAAWSRLRPRPHRRESIEPSVSVVISAHNEAAHIERKIANLLQLDYPSDRLEILIGSDGSSDGTVERLRAVSDTNVRIWVFDERRGKPAVLNMLMPMTRGEIVVLADARQQFDPGLLRTLVQPFADPQVGAVSGELILGRDPSNTTVGDGVGGYWRYEKFIRSNESRIDSTVGVTGAVYAIRRTLFDPIPEDTILDDVLIPLRIVRRGYRVLFEPGALARDVAAANAQQELTRKARTLAGNFQLFSREKWLLDPAQNRIWWQTVSHKVLRLLFPLLQVSALAANVALAGTSSFFRLALLAQMIFYTGAIAGWMLQRSEKKFFLATFPFTFCMLSWAAVLGFIRFVKGNQNVKWDKDAAQSLSSTAATIRSDVRPSHNSGTR